MAEAVIVQKKPFHVDVTEGETYAYCTCGLSDKQPLCNGAHKSGDFHPIKFTAKATETVHLCGCKRSAIEPTCDGAHKNL